MTPNPTSLQSPAAAEVELGLTKFLDPLRIPPVRKPHDSLEITMRATHAQLHSELPPTPVWAYDGHFPGPTIEVRSGRRLQVAWRNKITGAYPAAAVEVPVENLTAAPGRDGAEPRADVAALPPWTVVHLHGARTGAGNDGWTENAVLPGLAQLAEYPNDQPSTTMWYHDHAMAVTALNVLAGLAGMYIIRDDEEAALRLPHGDHEVPLIVCDRNLDTDENGEYTGDLLYKQGVLPLAPVPDPMVVKLPFSGPFTLVNGVIWPHLNVEARWYRFRLLNASNLRPYNFQLHDEHGELVHGALHQIGSDGGLLPAPAALDELTLSPGERADVLIDFHAFRGTSLTLVNTISPPVPGPISPNPDVMQFRVRSWPVHDHFTLPATLSPAFTRLTHDNLPKHEHRWLALTLLDGKHPEMWEMVEIEAEEVPPVLPVDGIVQVKLPDEPLKTFKRVSRDFKDAANFYVDQDGWEQWKIINLSPVALPVPHPIHIHLVRFQALSRDIYKVATFDSGVGGTTTPVTFESEGTLAAGEQGWKDTIRVGPNELVSVAGQFGGGSGRYMYHCHILEHEDEGMMRTFVVMPEEVMALDPHMHDPHDHDHEH